MKDVTVVSPAEAVLDCDMEPGTPEAEVRWYKGGSQITPSDKYEMTYKDKMAELKIKNSEPKDAATYKCEASNIIGTVDTSAKVTVHGKSSHYKDSKFSKDLLTERTVEPLLADTSARRTPLY
jgi:hypothetical protein